MVNKGTNTGDLQWRIYQQGINEEDTSSLVNDLFSTNGRFITQKYVKMRQWRNFTMTCDGHNLKMFVDGVIQDSILITGELIKSNTKFTIGARYSSGVVTSCFVGKLDDLRVYNRDLSENEVSALYQVGGWSSLNEGLLAYYPLDSNANDYSGNGFNGTPKEVIPTTDRNGNKNSAYEFNGISSYIDLPLSCFDGTTKGTISFWANINSLEESANFFKVSDSTINVGNGNSFSMWVAADDHPTEPNYFIHSHDTRVCGGSLPWDYDSSYVFELDKWNHITLIVDDNTTSYYLNGEQQSFDRGESSPQGLWINDLCPSLNYFWLGKSKRGIEESYFSGAMDEVIVWDRALTDDEIKRLYQSDQQQIVKTLKVLNETVDFPSSSSITISASNITASDNIISYQFIVNYDTTILEYSGYDITGTLSEGGSVDVNTDVKGKLSLGYINSTALSGSGDLINLQFNTLKADTTEVLISNAYFNADEVLYLENGTVIVRDVTPPTASITYADDENRCGDELLITATFDEPMSDAVPMQINFAGALPTSEEMTRISETEYTYTLTIPEADGEVTVTLSTGTDLWGNEVAATPTSGGTFSIIPISYGDVDDDGKILAYDAALTLQYSVGLDPLQTIDPLPWENWRDTTANVDKIGAVTANDAGIILQYSTGKITSFKNTKKTVTKAGISVETNNQEIIFYSSGELIGLNITTNNERGVLNNPLVLADNFLSALNINETTYKVGLCTANPSTDGTAIMKIPFNQNGTVTFDMIVNTEESTLTIDLVTGVVDMIKSGFNIYPNPTKDRLFIEFENGIEEAKQIKIINQLGFAEKVNIYSHNVDNQ